LTAPTPYGAWASSISPADLVKGAVGLHEVQADGDDLWWDEARPEEGGRIQLVRQTPDGTTTDVLPDGFAARTRVHEYGGGSWRVHDGVVYFSNWSDQRLHRLDPGTEPRPLTPDGCRYADMDVAPDGTWLVAVREDHRGEGEARNEVVRIDTSTGAETVLVTGPDFVASPRVNDRGDLAWTQWDHPDMPWDAAEVWIAELVDGRIESGERLAGGPGEWASQPVWSSDGSLWFTTDRARDRHATGSDTAELFRWDGGDEVDTITHRSGGDIATPPWVFRMSRFVASGTRGSDDPEGWAVVAREGVDVLIHVDGSGGYTDIDSPYTAINSLVPAPGGVAAVAATFTSEAAIVTGPAEDLRVRRPPRDLGLDEAQISLPEPISFPSAGGRTAHALYYPPTNPDHVGLDGEKPPLLVDIHGGPTGAARSQFQLGVQFWTSRGFGVVDVNYGGSTGYGRTFRDLLKGEWGVVDVEDCVATAQFLADRGDVDPARMAIRGGSAGGFTALAALAFHDTFAAGMSEYGVADLAVLAQETHKFESRYLDSLIGPWPEAADTYRDRSPLFHADAITVPLLVLQGLEDEVVPPNQSELIVDALKANGVPVAYLAFEGEQHGFRKAETIVRATEAELSFYAQVFGFTLADEIEPVEVLGL
jgi:dipeptidyl aminopeptidase/acylaminoacyl peptidase